MRRLTRYAGLAALILVIALSANGCKRKRKAAPFQASDEPATLVSAINVADARATIQLIRGFHTVEANAWRWTMGKFSVVLHPPANAAANGAKLRFKFTLPDAVLTQIQSTTLSASVSGMALPPETYSKAGVWEYVRDVPAAALAGDAVTVDFSLDKFLKPSAQDGRELGVVAQTFALEGR